jgi:hypothetical protein
MTTPGGAGTLCNALSHPPRARRTGFSHRVGAPTTPTVRGSGPSLSPSRCRKGRLMYTKATSLSNLYIRNIIPDDTDIPLLEHLALSGWGEAVFPNYVEEEFSEVRGSKHPASTRG